VLLLLFIFIYRVESIIRIANDSHHLKERSGHHACNHGEILKVTLLIFITITIVFVELSTSLTEGHFQKRQRAPQHARTPQVARAII